MTLAVILFARTYAVRAAGTAPAFEEADRARLIRLVTADAPSRLRDLDREIPRDLETVIHKAIERHPDHRYQTAAQLADDLRRFMEDRPSCAVDRAKRRNFSDGAGETRFPRDC